VWLKKSDKHRRGAQNGLAGKTDPGKKEKEEKESPQKKRMKKSAGRGKIYNGKWCPPPFDRGGFRAERRIKTGAPEQGNWRVRGARSSRNRIERKNPQRLIDHKKAAETFTPAGGSKPSHGWGDVRIQGRNEPGLIYGGNGKNGDKKKSSSETKGGGDKDQKRRSGCEEHL